MAEQIALDPEMSEQDVADVFEAQLIGVHVEDLPSVLSDPFQVAYLADGSAAIHIELKLTELPPFTTIKFVVHVGFQDGVANDVLSVRKGRLGL